MKMSMEEYRDTEYDYPVYCSKCDDIVGSGLEPDADPANSKEYECDVCDSTATCYGQETAMMRGYIAIEED